MTISHVENIDCMEAMKSFGDKFFDLAIVDPPYGINYANQAEKQSGSQYGNAAAKKRSYKGGDWDLKVPDKSYFDELRRVSKDQIIWGANYMTDHLPAMSGWIFWDKDTGTNCFSDGELAWTSFDVPLRKCFFRWNGMLQVNMKNKQQRIHPNEKPFHLYQWLLKNYAKPGDKILDTHLGSGSSRIAAYKMGFDFYGYEIDKDYFEAQEKRFKTAIAEPLFDNVKPEQQTIFK